MYAPLKLPTFVRIEAAACGLRADCVRITARFPHPGIIRAGAGNWASFVRIAATGCGSRADCGALSAPWYNPGLSSGLDSARPEMVIFPNLFVGRKTLWTFIYLRQFFSVRLDLEKN